MSWRWVREFGRHSVKEGQMNSRILKFKLEVPIGPVNIAWGFYLLTNILLKRKYPLLCSPRPKKWLKMFVNVWWRFLCVNENLIQKLLDWCFSLICTIHVLVFRPKYMQKRYFRKFIKSLRAQVELYIKLNVCLGTQCSKSVIKSWLFQVGHFEGLV